MPSGLFIHFSLTRMLIYFIITIIGSPAFGAKAGITQFPATVAVLHKDKFRCAGAAITDNWVITSAKCIGNIPNGDITLSVGSMYWQNGYKIGISKKVTDNKDKTSDIALLESKQKFKPDKLLNTITIHKNDVSDKAGVVISGWRHEKQMQQLEFTKLHVDVQKCGSVNDKQICATAGRGICVGNPGSPLIFKGKLLGMMPFVNKCEDSKPGVFVKLSQYFGWIKTKLKPYVDYKRTTVKFTNSDDDDTFTNSTISSDIQEIKGNNKKPMVASLQGDKKHICAAVFTNAKAKMAVVSAHCCFNPKTNTEISSSKLRIVGGTDDWSIRKKFTSKVIGKIFHPKFKKESILNSIAILKLDKRPNRMGILQWTTVNGLPNRNVVILGWQYKVDPKKRTRIAEKKLKNWKAKYIDMEQCRRYILEVKGDDYICGFTDVKCRGDLGAPVIATNGKQIAFLSYNGDCTQTEPQIFTKVAPFKKWMEQIAKRLS